MSDLLEVDNLRISARNDDDELTPIVKGVSFTVARGEVVALIGESGSGKTTIALSSLGYTKPGLEFTGGEVRLHGEDVISMDSDQLRGLRGQRVAYLAQSAAATFNPALTIGEQVTEKGIGNGISLLIFAGIVAGLPGAIGQSAEAARQGDLNILGLLAIAVIAIGVVAFVVFMERAQRRITVNYARRQQGNKVYAAQQSHLPLKINMAGVIPPIFASSLLLFPASIGQWFGQGEGMEWLQDISLALGPGQPLYYLLFTVGIVFFCYFYTALVFNPRDVADNLKKSGAFIPGIRPGEQSANYIDKVMSRLTFWGAAYIAAVSLLPQSLVVSFNAPFYFGGTSLLIVVVVVMDFMSQVQSHLMSRQYESLMKKSNLKGYGSGGLLR